MANEAQLRYNESAQGNVVHPVTVADGTGINKGSILKLTDANTGIITSAVADAVAGILVADKVANNGMTKMGVYKKGIFDMYASGAITVGAPVCTGALPNYVQSAIGVTAASGAAILGYALETAANGEQILVRLDL